VIRDVAVIVPAANEEHRIARCLTSIEVAVRCLSQRDPGIRARVIVTLDGCHDATAAICATFPGVSTVTTTGRNVGAARRAGTLAALSHHAGPAGELWLASTDADSAVPPGWLTAMVAAGGRGAGLVLGTVLPGPGLSPAARAQWLARHHLRDGHPYVHGANLGIRADAYLALGGWRPLATGEDTDLARRAASAGWLRISRPAAIPVVTSVRRTGRAPRGFSSYLRALSAPGGRSAGAGEADLDGAADLARLERRLGGGRGPAGHGAVRDAEGAAVPGAGQPAAGQLAV
jgi:cellulose synthase/poly-beta-1,6-N-acetylglucosamine synthase-like glycosyltransferase